MKKFFKKSISCIIAVLMVISAMPFTAITANAALAYQVTGQYDFTSTISDSTFSNAVEGYSGSSYILKGNAWDRDNLLASDSTTFDLKTIYKNYPCVTNATSGQAMTFHYDGDNDITVDAANVRLTGLYMYDGFMYIDNIGSYLSSEGFRISWTEQYFSKSIDSGAGVFSLGTGNNGDVLKWTTNDNKLYAGGSAVLDSTPVDGTVYDITLSSGSDKKISVLVKNHSTNATVIDYTTSGTFEPTSLNYLVIGSVNQGLDKLGRFTLSNLTIEKGYDISDPTAALANAISEYESKINSGTVYTNMKTAYDKYVVACKAYDAVKYGNADIDIDSITSELNTATQNMGTYTEPSFNVSAYFYNSSNIATDGYSNVVYQNNNPYSIFGYQGTNTWQETGRIRLKVALPYEMVLVYDGVNSVYSPATVQATNKDASSCTGGYKREKRLRYIALTSDSNNGYTKLELKQNWNMEEVNLTWKSPLNNNNPVPYQNSETNHGINFAGSGDNNHTITNRLYFTSVKPEGNTNTYYDKFSGEQIKFTIAAYRRSTSITGSERENAVDTNYYYAGGTQYVINYRPVKTKLSSAKTKLTTALNGKTVADYKEGGLSSILGLIDKCTADNVDPTKCAYSSGVETAVRDCANAIKAVDAVSVPDVITADSNQANYNSLKTEIDAYKSIIANDSYNNHPLSDYTDESVNNALDALASAQSFMANVYSDGYTKSSDALTQYNSLVNAKNALTLKTFTVKFIYTDNSVASTKEYTIGTPASAIDKPTQNTTMSHDENYHYSYSWPALSDVTNDAEYREISTPENHTWREDKEVPADCTNPGTNAGKTCTVCGVTEGYGVIPAKGHTPAEAVRENEVAETCTVDGSYDEVVYCSECKVELNRTKKTIPAKDHNFTVYEKLNADSHTVKCSRDCDEEGSTYTEPHDMDGNTCTKCGYIAKVTITFKAKDGSVIRSDDYDIGADITIPALPDAEYTANGDGATHTKVTYAWDNEPQTTAQTEATYTVVPTTDNAADCNFGDTATRRDVIIDGETYDIFTCTLCRGEKQVRVADMSALNNNIVALETAINVDDASYKYYAEALQTAKDVLATAKTYAEKSENRYADQNSVDAQASAVNEAFTTLTTSGLAKYNIKFQIVKDDGNGNVSLIKEYTDGYASLSYGSVVEFDKYVIPTVTDKYSPIFGLPQYAVYKWVKYENGVPTKLSTTNINISDIVKSDATYICYLLDFKATDETQTKTRVRYLDKSGHTIDFDQATIGQPYERKDTSKAPVIPYYTCTGWEPVFGDESNVGTRELVYKPIYTYKDSLANKCEIVGLNGVKVNGEERCQAIYDERIELSGADMFAYADENGNIIARINANYIYAPHIYGVSKTIYITKVETATEKAETIITGTFTIDNPNNTNIKYLVVNGQYYLPENAKVVECGIVIGNVNDAEALKIGSAVKVKSDSQGENHEYSVQMSYTKGNTGTLYSRSYLIYVDASGATQTVYSDAVTECIID